MTTRHFKHLILMLVLSLASGCASTADVEDGYTADGLLAVDPYEELNRSLHGFNKALDNALLKPLAQGYRKSLPESARIRVSNFFDNLDEPISFLNNILQIKPADATANLGRFTINSTIGLAGFFDVASEMGIEKAEEDFGQTFRAVSGSSGVYLVLPFFGPSSTEDVLGTVGDVFMNSYVKRSIFDDDATEYVLTGVDLIDTRSGFLDFEETMGDSVLDEYSFIRDAYLSRREHLTVDGDR